MKSLACTTSAHGRQSCETCPGTLNPKPWLWWLPFGFRCSNQAEIRLRSDFKYSQRVQENLIRSHIGWEASHASLFPMNVKPSLASLSVPIAHARKRVPVLALLPILTPGPVGRLALFRDSRSKGFKHSARCFLGDAGFSRNESKATAAKTTELKEPWL